MPPTATKGKKNLKKAGNPLPGKPLVYPEYSHKTYRGEGGLTAEEFGRLMGFEPETEDNKLGDDYMFIDHMGRKVRANNNKNNRPFTPSRSEALEQTMLHRVKWKFNGEPVLVGVYGSCLSGQHQGVALWQAELRRQGWYKGKMVEAEKAHWAEVWGDGPVRIDKAVTFGIPEDDDTVDTIDTAKPRLLDDIFFRKHYWGDKSLSDQKKLSKALSFMVSLLWDRTGRTSDAWNPILTNSFGAEYLDRHPHAKKALIHIFDEDGSGKKITRLVGLGGAATLMYLMAASGTDAETAGKYRDGNPWDEKDLDMSRWGEAEEFWTLFAGGEDFEPVRETIAMLQDKDTLKSAGFKLKSVVIVKAWKLFLAGAKRFDPKELRPEYVTDASGVPQLINVPVIGGIDTEGQEPVDKPVTEDEAEERKRRHEAGEDVEPEAEDDGGKTGLVEIDALRKEHPGAIVLRGTDGPNPSYVAVGPDAEKAAKALKLKPSASPSGPRLSFPADRLTAHRARLIDAGLTVLVCKYAYGKFQHSVWTPAPKEAAKPKKGKK